MLQHYSARGKTSGAELGGVWAEGANLFTIREGKVTRLVCYFDRERALTDVQCGARSAGAETLQLARTSSSRGVARTRCAAQSYGDREGGREPAQALNSA